MTTSTTSTQAARIDRWTAGRRHTTLPHGEIAYSDIGSGPAALLVHGFPLSSLHWQEVAERLAPYRRCIAPDLLAHGHTHVAEGQGVDLHAQADMLLHLLDHLQIPRVDLIGNDSGTAICQLLAARAPDRVRSLLLTNGDVEPDSPPAPLQPFIAQARNGRFATDTVEPTVRDHAFARSPQGVIGLTFTHPDLIGDQLIDAYLTPLVSTPDRRRLIDAYCAGLDPNPLVGVDAALAALSIPTTVVWGDGDVLFKPADPDHLAGVLTVPIRIVRVPGARLFFPEEQPDLIATEAYALFTQADADHQPPR